MSRLRLEDLEGVAAEQQRRNASYKAMLMVCTGTGCVSARGFEVRDSLTAALRERGLENEYLVVQTGCNGFCAMGPIVVVQPEGTFYQKVTEKDLHDIVEGHLLGGRPVERLRYAPGVRGANKLKGTP